MPVHGVIFDVGGTLVTDPNGESFELAGAEAVERQLCSWGRLPEANGLADLLVRWRRANPKEGERFRNVDSTREALMAVAAGVGIDLDEADIDELELVFHRPFIRAATPVPGIPELIRDLAGQVQLAAVSNTRSHRLIAGIVERIGLLGLFDPLLTSERFGWRKPSPLIFRAVLEQWGLDPAEVVMVGDSPEKDIAGASMLGMRTILFGDQAAGGTTDAVAGSSRELGEILAGWLR
jgi:HAD superfamily hydrolase (TIGR01509 family)